MRLRSVILCCSLIWVAGCASKVPENTGPVVRQALHDAAFYRDQRQQALALVTETDPQSGASVFRGETIRVTLANFFFDPNVITLKAGQVVRLRLENPARMTHYFGGDDLFTLGGELLSVFDSKVPPGQHHIPVPPEQSRDLYLYVKDPGDYVLDCFVPVHRQLGMTGRIEIR